MRRKNPYYLFIVVMLSAFFLLEAKPAMAQVPVTQQMPDTAKMTYNQISKAMNLYVYPSKKTKSKPTKKG
jgi:hypothetical protein